MEITFYGANMENSSTYYIPRSELAGYHPKLRTLLANHERLLSTHRVELEKDAILQYLEVKPIVILRSNKKNYVVSNLISFQLAISLDVDELIPVTLLDSRFDNKLKTLILSELIIENSKSSASYLKMLYSLVSQFDKNLIKKITPFDISRKSIFSKKFNIDRRTL